MNASTRLFRPNRHIPLALTMAVGLAGCGPAYRPMDTMNVKSDLATWFYSLFLQITIWDSIVLAIVTLILFLALFRFSSLASDPGEPAPHESDFRLEVAWTVGPALILLF